MILQYQRCNKDDEHLIVKALFSSHSFFSGVKLQTNELYNKLFAIEPINQMSTHVISLKKLGVEVSV